MTQLAHASTLREVTVRTPEKTAKLLLRTEQIVHRGGWDQPAFLGSLHETRPGVISLLPFPFPIENPPGQFVEFVAQVAEAAPEHAHTFVNRSDSPGPIFGLAFVSEGWMVKVKNPEERREAYGSGKSLSEHPDRIEVRSVSAVDTTGQVYFINRDRGKKPTWHSDMESGGRIPESLRRILLAGMKTLPDREDAILDLSTTFIPNYNDMEAAQEVRDAARKKE